MLGPAGCGIDIAHGWTCGLMSLIARNTHRITRPKIQYPGPKALDHAQMMDDWTLVTSGHRKPGWRRRRGGRHATTFLPWALPCVRVRSRENRRLRALKCHFSSGGAAAPPQPPDPSRKNVWCSRPRRWPRLRLHGGLHIHMRGYHLKYAAISGAPLHVPAARMTARTPRYPLPWCLRRRP